jgi:hypothetical protein
MRTNNDIIILAVQNIEVERFAAMKGWFILRTVYKDAFMKQVRSNPNLATRKITSKRVSRHGYCVMHCNRCSIPYNANITTSPAVWERSALGKISN